jgi:hypothetical protein
MEMLNLNIELLVRGKYIINVKSEMIWHEIFGHKGRNIRFLKQKVVIGTKTA